MAALAGARAGFVAPASRWRASAIASAVALGHSLEEQVIGCGAVLRTRAMQPPSVTSESFLAGIPHHRSPGTCRAVPVCCSQSNSKGVREPEPGTASGPRALRAAPHASILSATVPQPPSAALACAHAGFVAPASRWRASAVGDSPDRPVLRHEATGPQSEDALPTPVQALLRSSLPPVPFTSRSRGAALPLPSCPRDSGRYRPLTMTPDSSSPPASPTSRSGIRTPDSAPSPSRARQRLRQSRRTSRCSGATSRAAVPAERACTSSGSSVRVSRRSAAAQSPRRLHLSRVADVDSPIQNAGGKCPSDRLRGSVLTPHASLMQDVPCLHLSGLLTTFAAKHGPKGVGPSVLRRAIRDSLSSCPCLTSPVTHRYTTAVHSGAQQSRTAIRAPCAMNRPDADLIAQDGLLNPAGQDPLTRPNSPAKRSH